MVELLAGYPAYVPKWEQRLGAIGCVDKLQLCRARPKEECSPWVGVVRGDQERTGLEDFYNRSSEVDKGLISLLIPRKPNCLTIADVARTSGPRLIASRSLISLPLLGNQLSEIQTANAKDQWKREVSQCKLTRPQTTLERGLTELD
jgi:hypothetical protein